MPERSLSLYLSASGKWKTESEEVELGKCLSGAAERFAGSLGFATLILSEKGTPRLEILAGYEEEKPIFTAHELPVFASLEALELFL